MKKFLNIFLIVALAAAASMSFTACGDDDEPDQPIPSKTIKETQVKTIFYVNQAIRDTYDINVTCLGQELSFLPAPVDVRLSDGQIHSMYAVELDGQGNTLPLISIMNVTYTLKEGYTVPEKSDFALAVEATGTITYTDGTTEPYGPKSTSLINTGVFGSKIDDYTASLNRRFGRLKVTLESSGLDLDTDLDD